MRQRTRRPIRAPVVGCLGSTPRANSVPSAYRAMYRRISWLATRCRSHGPTSILHLATVTASREGRASSSMAFAEPARQRTDKTKAGELWLPGVGNGVARSLRLDDYGAAGATTRTGNTAAM